MFQYHLPSPSSCSPREVCLLHVLCHFEFSWIWTAIAVVHAVHSLVTLLVILFSLYCSVLHITSPSFITITESVDSVCRDGTDMPYVAIQTEAWKTAKTTAIRLYGCLTFILECFLTTKTFKVISKHRGSTKLEFVKTANCSPFFLSFSDGLSQHCRKYSL